MTAESGDVDQRVLRMMTAFAVMSELRSSGSDWRSRCA